MCKSTELKKKVEIEMTFYALVMVKYNRYNGNKKYFCIQMVKNVML